MASPLEIKRNDLQPFVYFEAKDTNDNVIDLTGATFATSLTDGNGVLKINRRATGVLFNDATNGDNQAQGRGHFEWTAGDTNKAGKFKLEIEVTPSAGGKFTMGPWDIVIDVDLDNT